MRIGAENTDLSLLFDRCRKGDSVAWGRLVERFSDYVYSIPKRYGLNEDDSADIHQQSFQALYGSLDKLGSAHAIPKWLAVTAARLSLRLIRFKGGRAEEYSDLDELVADEEQSAEESAVQADQARVLREAVDRLGGRCSPLLTKLYLAGEASYEEVSGELGIPLGALGPTRARCLQKLRELLTKEGFF